MSETQSTGQIKVWTYYSDSTHGLEDRVQNLIDRGGKIISLAIGYGPPPARIAAQPYASENAWHAMVVVDTSEIDPDA
jgi:hypothetical protein